MCDMTTFLQIKCMLPDLIQNCRNPSIHITCAIESPFCCLVMHSCIRTIILFVVWLRSAETFVRSKRMNRSLARSLKGLWERDRRSVANTLVAKESVTQLGFHNLGLIATLFDLSQLIRIESLICKINYFATSTN